MSVSVSLAKNGQKILTRALVNPGRQVSETLAGERGGVHERRNECASTFSPMVVTIIEAASSSDVGHASRREYCTIPRQRLAQW